MLNMYMAGLISLQVFVSSHALPVLLSSFSPFRVLNCLLSICQLSGPMGASSRKEREDRIALGKTTANMSTSDPSLELQCSYEEPH